MNDKTLRPACRTGRVLLVSAGLLATAFSVRAAGGHHAVDDAALIEPGQCQVETWADREQGGARSLLHVGPACRVGPVELALNLDRTQLSGTGAVVTAGPQLKWATPLGKGVSVGLVVFASGQERAPHYLGSSVVLPVTWQASETWLVHVNAGRDFRHYAGDDSRAGAAVEWMPSQVLSFVAERFREGRRNFSRAGARWTLDPALSIDLGRARSLQAGVPAWWTLGFNWTFAR